MLLSRIFLLPQEFWNFGSDITDTLYLGVYSHFIIGISYPNFFLGKASLFFDLGKGIPQLVENGDATFRIHIM